MQNRILSDVAELGLDNLQGKDIYEAADKNAEQKKSSSGKHEKTEVDYLLKKTYVCPVCNTTFKSLRVKTTKPQLLGTDPDMRPIHKYMDITKYDCIACEKCGYAALAKYFEEISDSQIRTIRSEITPRFKGLKESGETYTYDEAITRFQLALANAMVKHGRTSERAYICLKLAWLYRGKRNAMIFPEEKQKQALYEAEIQYIKKAREGFINARMKEMFPIAGMDEWTYDFLLAELSIECNEVSDAKKLISNIIVSGNAPSRVKDKARELRDFLNEENEE